MNIVFILPNLRSGGSERVVVNLANEFNNRNHDVTIILISGNDMTLSQFVNSNVKIINLGFKRFRYIIFQPWVFISILNKINPNILISAFGEINPLIIPFKFLFKRTVFLARESSIPSLRIKNKLIKISYRLFYNYYDKIIVQSKAMEYDLIKNFSISQRKINLISNPLDTTFIDKNINVKEDSIDSLGEYLLYVGTIDLNKRLDKIIFFYNYLRDQDINYKLIIIGDGPELLNIQLLIRKSNFYNDIIVYPYTSNPFIYMKNAKFLLIASDYEGFPNVGIEANYCGLPIILSHETRGGARELIIDDLNGLVLNFDKPMIEKLNYNFNRNLIIDNVYLKHNVSKVVDAYLSL